MNQNLDLLNDIIALADSMELAIMDFIIAHPNKDYDENVSKFVNRSRARVEAIKIKANKRIHQKY